MGGKGQLARVAQDILTALNREADSNRECRGQGVMLVIARDTGLEEARVRAYIDALVSLGVVKINRKKEPRAPGYSRPRAQTIITVLMPDAVFAVERGYLRIVRKK